MSTIRPVARAPGPPKNETAHQEQTMQSITSYCLRQPDPTAARTIFNLQENKDMIDRRIRGMVPTNE